MANRFRIDGRTARHGGRTLERMADQKMRQEQRAEDTTAELNRATEKLTRLFEELSEKNRSLEAEIAERKLLERQIVNIGEDERRRISHELHDGLCQQLTAARLHYSLLAEDIGGQGNHPALAQLSALLEAAINQAYDLSYGLWPVERDHHDAVGIAPSLDGLIARLRTSSGIPIDFVMQQRCAHCTNNGGVTQLYRIAQEALTNAVKHARASRIVVKLDCEPPNLVVLRVQDNGIGRRAAPLSKGGLGMGIMAHRARIVDGHLEVQDAEGGGTLVTCVIPCPASTPCWQG